MIDKKPCRGNGVARGHGCGELVPVSLHGKSNRTYGLGHQPCGCYAKWLFNADSAKSKRETFLIKVKHNSKREEKKKNKLAKMNLISPDKYRSRYLQPRINEIARLLDFGHSCIATGNYGKMSGGHYISVGANRTICLNLHNIFIQSFESNYWKSGDPLKYQEGLIQTFGFDYFKFIQSLSQHKPLKLTTEEMIEKHNECLKIIRELKKDQKIRTQNERIEGRNEINLRLDIYDPEFCEYII